MSIIDWPPVLRPTLAYIPMLEKNSASGGVSLTGQERLVSTDSGRWRFGVNIPIRNREEMLAWRSLVAMCEERQNLIRLPICDMRYDPAALAGFRKTLAPFPDNGIPHSDGTRHSDGTGYANSIINSVVKARAGQGQTAIRVQMPTGMIPYPGHFFSDGDRLYRVKAASLVSGSTYRLNFSPRLRLAIEENAEVSFDRLSCVVRFASEDMLFTAMNLLKFSDLDLEFTEALV